MQLRRRRNQREKSRAASPINDRSPSPDQRPSEIRRRARAAITDPSDIDYLPPERPSETRRRARAAITDPVDYLSPTPQGPIGIRRGARAARPVRVFYQPEDPIESSPEPQEPGAVIGSSHDEYQPEDPIESSPEQSIPPPPPPPRDPSTAFLLSLPEPRRAYPAIDKGTSTMNYTWYRPQCPSDPVLPATMQAAVAAICAHPRRRPGPDHGPDHALLRCGKIMVVSVHGVSRLDTDLQFCWNGARGVRPYLRLFERGDTMARLAVQHQFGDAVHVYSWDNPDLLVLVPHRNASGAAMFSSDVPDLRYRCTLPWGMHAGGWHQTRIDGARVGPLRLQRIGHSTF